MNEKDRIKGLRRRLYSRREISARRRHGLSSEESSVKRSWTQSTRVKKDTQVKEKRSLLGLFFLVSLLFFIGSVLFGSFYFLGEKNIVSSDNVDIQIQGPTAIGGGEELELQISIVNKNATTLELTDLLIEYPKGTRVPGNLQNELTRFRKSIGNIAPGKRINESVGAILFGEENTQKSIIVTVEYRVAGSNAIFFAEKEYLVTLSSSPVSVSVRSFSEVVSGQEIGFTVVINSNSSTPVENLILKAEYPFGFSFVKAEPESDFSNSIWDIGDLKPEQEKTIHIFGIMTGQDNEERVFRFDVGVRDKLDVKKLATTFVSSTRGITIKRPFISADITLNDRMEDLYVFSSGEQINGEIAWKNNLTDTITDAQFEIHLSGNSIDEGSVLAEQGFYNSVTDTLRWGKDTSKSFGELSPSQAGIIKFNFKTKNIAVLGIRNPEIILNLTVRGRRESEDNVPENIESIITRKIRISSDLNLTSRLLYNTGGLVNSGPIPPVAEKETLYTVVWTITNTANYVSGAKVVAELPSYVRWTGNFTPKDSKISFNPNSNQVMWNIGEVKQGVGTNVSPKEVSFQIGLTPSLSQVGGTPALVHNQSIVGFDQFTEAQISSISAPLTTQITSETGLPGGHERVSEN